MALLVRESEDLITSALRSSQINILLSMFTTSAIFVIEKNSKIDNSVRVSTKSSTSIESCSKEILLNLVDSLNAELLESLPALFIRFRDDPNCQDWLLRLFGCLQLSSQTKQVDSIVKLALELLQTVRTESSLLKIVSTLATWSRTIGPLSTSLNVALGKMLQSSWRDFLSSCKTLSERVESYSGDKKKKNARKSTVSVNIVVEL